MYDLSCVWDNIDGRTMALRRSRSSESVTSFVSFSEVQGFIAVPSDKAERILEEGYMATKRRFVPITLVNDPPQAVRAMSQYPHNKTPQIVLLEVRNVEEDLIDREAGKIKLQHLPATHLSDGIFRERTSQHLSAPCPFCGRSIPEFADLRGRIGEYRFFEDATFVCSPCPNESCKGAQRQRQERLKDGQIRTLYHQTDQETAKEIKKSGKMIRGSGGAGGGGIYLAESARETEWKAEHHGVVLECEVRLGTVKNVVQHDKKKHPRTFAELQQERFDSVKLDRGFVPKGMPHAGERSGDEYVLYSWDQVKVLREVPRVKRTCVCCKDKPDKK